MLDDFDGVVNCVGSVIVPLAAYCEAIHGCVAALVILPQLAGGSGGSGGNTAAA